MDSRSQGRKAWCIIRWLVIGSIAGLVVASVISYGMPRMYESSASVKSTETPGKTVSLSAAHAAQALRLVTYQNPPNPGEHGRVAKVCENTHITAKDGIVQIRVRCTNKFKARDLALELAFLFRSMDEEESLASPVPDPLLLTDEEMDALDRRMKVEELMNDECREAGCVPVFRAVPTLRALGSPEAEKVWEMESFQLHWRYFADTTWQIAGGARSELPQLPLIGYPIIEDKPVSPNIDLYLQSGIAVGMAFGGLAGYFRSRKIKDTPFPADDGSSAIPAYAAIAPPPLPGTQEWRKPIPSPEDDW